MHGSLAAKAPAAATIYDQNEKVGVALRSRDEVKPIFVSPGHLIDLPGALQITKNCLRGYRMPEPTRQAHLLVNRLRKGEEKTGFKNYD
jgi:deoxyribonuclease V